ncbi:MAG TPA: MarC family protein [Acidobacteriota bacterium]|jgi:multiple antibiotic resistance protein|nr:NAAT family transporter [Acidobacteriota bacterium]HNR40456.1 MarC family protein [Acidobacteriota bacterium]HNU02406.1 MarC family protein [Acidobacteriota bacterium]HPB29358.1 MarC family protein [Acidobacteriota bacterium]HQO26925.1 MarC family protein [Acidobacteriota bacterium]
MGFLHGMLFAFLALFPILNPPAMSPVFRMLTARVSDEERHKLALLIGCYSFALLTALLFVGGWLLKLFGISIPVISVAGGLLLFHTAWRMLNREPKISAGEQEELQTRMLDRAFFPLTMPVTAGPGSMAITLTLVPEGSILEVATLVQFAAVTAGIALAALSIFLFYRFSGVILGRMGKTGQATINQVSAFILLAIGVQIVWNGVRGLLATL